MKPAKFQSGKSAEAELEKCLTPGNLVLVSLIPAKRYPDYIDSLMKFLSLKRKKICIVSLTKPFMTLTESFSRAGIDPKKFFIIDAVSRMAGWSGTAENAIFVSSPSAITELGIKIGEALKRENFDFFILDSISVLLMYVPEHEVLKFVHMLVSRFRANGICSLFTVLLEDTETRAVRNMCMFADAVVDLGG